MNNKGETLKGIYTANEFLTCFNLMKSSEQNCDSSVYKGKHVVVVGGSDAAMYAARCAKRIGADVTVVYRKTEKELPARPDEVEYTMQEGIQFEFLTQPVKIYGDSEGWVNGLICQEMIMAGTQADGQKKPVPLYESEFDMKTDCVIMEFSTSSNSLFN